MLRGQKNIINSCKNSQVYSYGGASLTGQKRIINNLHEFTASSNSDTLFVLHVGTNDLMSNKRNPTEILSKYKELIRAVKEKSRSGKICVLGLLPVPRESLNETTSRKDFNISLHNMAIEENILFFSTWNCFAQDPNYKSLFSSDGLHLSASGNSTLKRLLNQLIQNFHSIPASQFHR